MPIRIVVSLLICLKGLTAQSQKAVAIKLFHDSWSICNGGIYTTLSETTIELLSDSTFQLTQYKSESIDRNALSRVVYSGSFIMKNDTIKVTYNTAKAALARRVELGPANTCLNCMILKEPLADFSYLPTVFVIAGNKLFSIGSKSGMAETTANKVNELKTKFETWASIPQLPFISSQPKKKHLLAANSVYPWHKN